MKASLNKKVKIYKYQVLMSLDVEENHPEVLIWLKGITEAKNSNENVVDYFQEKFFKGSKKPKQFIKNILKELVINGFLDNDYTLTVKGIKTIEEGIVYLPQEGIYEISVINDALFPQVIIEFTELKPSLYHEFSAKSKNVSKIQRNVEIPNFIFKAQNIEKMNTINKNGYKSIIVSKIGNRGNKITTQKETNVKLEIDESFNVTQKIFYINNYHSLNTGAFNGNKIIEELLEKYTTNADLELYRIPVSYDNISLNEKKSFLKDFKFSTIVLHELYVFDSASLEQVSIYPQDNLTAIKWGEDLLINSINTYLTSYEMQKIWKDISENFAFNLYQFPELTKKNLLKNINFGSEKYWFLITPEDLQLESALQND